MKRTSGILLSLALILLVLLLPLSVSSAEGQPAEDSVPAEGLRMEYQDYLYEFTNDEYDGPHWEIKEYLGTYLPRISPDEKIQDTLEGFPVLSDYGYDLHCPIYEHLSRSYGNYRYALVSETECYLTGYNDEAEEIATLPAEIDGIQVVGIADCAFYCSGFTCPMFANTVVFPETIRYIGKNAFGLCDTRSFILCEGIEFIDDWAFVSMFPEEIYLPKSLKKIGVNPFMADGMVVRGNQSLHFLGSDGKREKYSNGIFAEINGALYSLDDMKLISYLDQSKSHSYQGELTEYFVQEGTRMIGDFAFSATYDLDKIILPEGVEIIGADAFEYCMNLNEIIIPSTVTDIQNGAFYECDSLTEAILPEGLKAIGDYAFSGCSSLFEMTIPASVVSIGEYAFENCDPSLILTVTPGSAAEKYCVENGIAYKTAAE